MERSSEASDSSWGIVGARIEVDALVGNRARRPATSPPGHSVRWSIGTRFIERLELAYSSSLEV